MSDFASLLAELRTARNWSQGKLAQESGLDPSTVSRFEAGTRAPERETVLRIADALVLPVVERERLLGVAGFRSAAWDDPQLAELVQILADPSLPTQTSDDIRTLIRVAIQHGRRAQGLGRRPQ